MTCMPALHMNRFIKPISVYTSISRAYSREMFKDKRCLNLWLVSPGTHCVSSRNMGIGHVEAQSQLTRIWSRECAFLVILTLNFHPLWLPFYFFFPFSSFSFFLRQLYKLLRVYCVVALTHAFLRLTFRDPLHVPSYKWDRPGPVIS